ncbi:hypothetical protein [Ligilactobacillus ruminis]
MRKKIRLFLSLIVFAANIASDIPIEVLENWSESVNPFLHDYNQQ